jgi:hypothetical protein
MAGDNEIRVTEPPVPARLISFDPCTPTDIVDLGLATSWFPSFDGTGVWRVLSHRTDPWPRSASQTFDATEFGLDGMQRAATIRLKEGQHPVAATARGLAIEVPIPNRRYPDHVVSGPRTLVGGVVVDLVELDLVTRNVVAVIDEYTRVRVAAARGLALVGNSDPNVKVRPTEIINLSGDSSEAPPVDLPELAMPPLVQSRIHLHGPVVVHHLVDEPRCLLLDPPGGDQVEVTSDLVAVSRRSGEGWRELQDFIWVSTTLLFPEAADGGVRIAAWTKSTAETERSHVLLPLGSYPIGGCV